MRSILTIIFLLSSVNSHADDLINEIKVLDSNFKVIMIISKSSEIIKAEKAWKELTPISVLPNTNWTHKIDIKSETIGGRWLYNKKGYIAKLNKQLKPLYKVNDIEEFNKLYLGL